MTIIDKRKSGKNKSVDNRQRFIKRYKRTIKRNIEIDSNEGEGGSITDGMKNRKARISKKDISEPDFSLDPSTGRGKRVLPGNKDFSSGDRIKKSSGGRGRGNQGSDSSNGEEDEFTFVLSREEFMDLYFSDLELPDFIKQSLKDNKQYKLVRSGYSKDGIPPRMDLLKTFKQAIARRIASRNTDNEEDKKPRFLDDIDIRYKNFVKKPLPIHQAHVFFLMDVSGSMGEYEKMLAKKFFTLLYIFLDKEYEKISVTFIRHTEEAKEVTEHDFFYSRESGGTIVSKGLALINQIIDEKINLSEVNVYVAQASDGDNFSHDDEPCVDELLKVLTKVQYFAYIQTEDADRQGWKGAHDIEDLFSLYSTVAASDKKLNIKKVNFPQDVFPVLRELFSKEGA